MKKFIMTVGLCLTLCGEAHAYDALTAAAVMACPQGTPAVEVPRLVAEYVADWMHYSPGMERGADGYELSRALYEGCGVCLGYSLLYCEILQNVPIDSAGVVNYHTFTPVFYHCCVLYNGPHAWAAVWNGVSWVWYDVTFFDNLDGQRRSEYAPVVIEDGAHGPPVLEWVGG